MQKHDFSTTLAILGYALVYLISSLTVWSGTFAFLSATTASSCASALQEPSTVRSIAYCLAYLLGGLLAARPGLPSRVLPLVGGSTLLAGIGLAVFMQDETTVLLVASALLGVGSASFFMTWELVFSRQPHESLLRSIGIAAIVSSAIYLGLSAWPAILPCMTALIGVGATVLGCILARNPHSPMQKPYRALMPSNAKQVVCALGKPTLCVAAYGFVHSVVRSVSFSQEAIADIVNVVFALGILISGVVLLALHHASRSGLQLTTLYRVAFPIAVTGFIALPFLGEVYCGIFVIFVTLAFSVLISMLMVSCIRMGTELGVNPVSLFGLSSFVVYLFSFIGSHYGIGAAEETRFGVPHIFLIAFFSMYMLALVYFAIRDRKAPAPVAASNVSEAKDALTTEELCRLLAAAFSLTPRERDVLCLYATGRDAPYISEKLSISENTVRTHQRSFYRKMGIHNKQELLDLLEKTAAGAAGDSHT